MTSPYHIPFHHRVSRHILRQVFRAIFRAVARVRIVGLENVPSEGPYVLVFNHVSYYDPPVIVAFWPHFPEVVGAEYLWSRPLLSLFAKAYGGIPIRRGEVDRVAMDRVMRALRNGFPVMLAPEGTRSHNPGMQMGKPGIVYIVERTQSPVVPVGIVGTTDEFLTSVLSWKRPEIELRVGSPFLLPEFNDEGLQPKEVRQRKVDYIMDRIASLLPHEYRGAYANHPIQNPIG